MEKKYRFSIETDNKKEMQLFKHILQLGLEHINKFNYEIGVVKSLHNKLDYSLEMKKDE